MQDNWPIVLSVSIALGIVFVALVAPDRLVWVYDTINRVAGEEYTTPPPSVILRNLLLILTPIIGFPLLVWRGWSADRQARSAEGTLIFQRRQKALENIDSDNPMLRQYGIEEIQLLDKKYKIKYKDES